MNPDQKKQYFIALVPPSPVYEEAQALKELFRDRYHTRGALKSPPHITLHMPFLWHEQKEEHLVNALRSFAVDRDPIKVCLDNFSSFPPKVIFLRVAESDVLKQLQQDLHEFCQRNLNIFNARYKDRPFHPHLTVAFRDLKKPQYEKAWKEFAGQEYKAEFTADRMVLLKHNGQSWKVHAELPFHATYSTEEDPQLDTTEG